METVRPRGIAGREPQRGFARLGCRYATRVLMGVEDRGLEAPRLIPRPRIQVRLRDAEKSAPKVRPIVAQGKESAPRSTPPWECWSDMSLEPYRGGLRPWGGRLRWSPIRPPRWGLDLVLQLTPGRRVALPWATIGCPFGALDYAIPWTPRTLYLTRMGGRGIPPGHRDL